MRFNNHIETRRNIWQNALWGISGALDWDFEMLHNHSNSAPKVWSIYERVADFFDDVDLDGENWHSGMTRLKNNGNLKYKKSYRDDCIRDDELADVVYLRSGDKEKAFGVITNRRANYYTLGEGKCVDNSGEITAPLHSKHDNDPSSLPDLTDYTVYSDLLQEYGSVEPEGGNNRLRLRNMANFGGGGLFDLQTEYLINYYSPYDQITPLKSEVKLSPILTLEYPDLDTLDIILFEVSPLIGQGFKSGDIDSTDSEDIVTRESKKEYEDEVKVYPNPNDGKFVIYIENPNEVSSIRILDNLGKIIDTRTVVKKENQYNINTLNSGLYFIEVVNEDKIIQKKIVVN